MSYIYEYCKAAAVLKTVLRLTCDISKWVNKWSRYTSEILIEAIQIGA